MTSKDGQILLNIDADISKFETKLESLEKKKIKDIKLNVDDSSIEKTQRQIDLLVSKIERLYETREKLSTSFLSSEKQREALRLKNKEQAIRLEIEKEKQKFKAIELEHQKWEAKYSARTQRSILNIKNAHTLELREHSKMLAAKTKADKEYEKTFFGAITAGTSFGHKVATTAQYALAGSALYGVVNAARQATAAIIETDKYFNMFRGVLEQTDEQAKKLQQSIFNVGKEFGGTNQQLSEAALQLGRAGLKGEALASGLKVASQMALVAGDGLENITEMLTAWSTVYPEKKMEDLGDMMVAVSNASLLSIDGLKTATSYILATGQSAGMTADSLIQLAGAWKQTGKADSIVGTEIRRLFEQIENASKDVRKAYWEMGIDLNKVNEGLKSESAEVKEATFRSFMGMIANVENLAPAQKKAVNEAIAQLQVLDKQTVNSSKVASKSYADMEKAGDKAAGSLNESSGKIAVSYEKMIERLIIAGKESSVVFEETFSKALFGEEGGTEKFNEAFDKLSKKLNAFAETTGEAAAAIVDNFDKIALAATLYKVSGWLDKGFAAHGIALAAQAIAVGKLSTAWKAFNLVLAKNPLIFAAMAGITIYGLLADNIYDATAAVEKFNKANRKTFDDNSTVEAIEAQIEAYSKEVEAREKVLKGLEPDTIAYDTQIAHIKNLTSELNKLYAIIDKRNDAAFTAIDAEFAKLETGVDISAKGDLKTADKRGCESSKDKALKEQFKEHVKLIKLDEERWLTQNATATEIEKQAHHTNTTLQYTVLLAKAYQGVKGLSDDIVQTQIDLEEGQRKLNDLVIQNKEAAQDKIAQNNYELSIMRDITEEAHIRNEATKSYQSVADAYLASQKTIYDEQVAQSGVLKVQAETEYKLEELARKRAEANTLVSLELQEQRNAQIAMLNNEIGLSPAQNEFDAAAMQYQIDQRRLELQLVEDIRNTEDPAQIQAINDAYLARTSLLKDNLDVLEQMSEFNIEIEGIDKLQESFDSLSESMDGLVSEEWQNFDSAVKKAQKIYTDYSKKTIDLDKKTFASNKKLHNAFIDANGDETKEKAAMAAFDAEQAEINQERQTAEIAGYAALAGAIGSAFEEGSGAAKAFQAIQATLGIVNGFTAIAQAWASAPFPANLPAVALTTAQMLPLIGTLTSLGGSSGSGSGGSSSPYSASEMSIAKTTELEDQSIVDRLDQQIELLEAIERNGSAQKLNVDLAKAEFEQAKNQWVQDVFDMSRMGWVNATFSSSSEHWKNISEYYAADDASGDVLKNPYEMQGSNIRINSEIFRKNPDDLINVLADLVQKDDFYTGPFGQKLAEDLGWGAEAHQAFKAQIESSFVEIQGYLNDWVVSLADSTAEIKDASDDMKDMYDNISGTDYFKLEAQNKAFEEFDKLLSNGQDYGEFLKTNAIALEAGTKFLDGISNVKDPQNTERYLTNLELLLSKSPELIDEQLVAVAQFNESTANMFNSMANGATATAEDIINSMESLEIVTEVLATSRENIKSWQDSFKSADELAADMANTLGVELATSLIELDKLFIKLSNDADGLTDADLDLLNANKDLLEIRQEEADAISSTINGIIASIKGIDDSIAASDAFGGMKMPTNLIEWEAFGKSLIEDGATDSQISAFEELGNALKEQETAIKENSEALLIGDGLKSAQLMATIMDRNGSDYAELTDSNIIKELDRLARSYVNAIEQTSKNALQIQDAMRSIGGLKGELATFSDTNSPMYSYDKYIASSKFPDSASRFVEEWVNYTITEAMSNRYNYDAEGVSGIMWAEKKARDNALSAKSLRTNKTIYGADVIAYDRTIASLDNALKQGLITLKEYSITTQKIESQSKNIAQLAADTTKQWDRVIDSFKIVSQKASESITYYFSQITSSADAYQYASETTKEAILSVTEATGRLKSLTDVLNFSASKVNLLWNSDAQSNVEIAKLIATTAQTLASSLTTQSAEEVASELLNISSISTLSSDEIKKLSLILGEVGAFDTSSIEFAFNQLNSELIKGNINQEQYTDLFNYSLDIYKDMAVTQDEQLSVLKDIRDYQRSLLLGDASGLDIVGRYNYASIETASLAQQAKDALIGGDINAFNSLFSQYKDISSQFLDLSKDLSGNQATYMNDFLKVYSVIDELGNMVDGSHANGLDYVPFDGYRAELHKGERVQTASEVQKDVIITELKNELRELKEIFLKNTAETTRMSKAIHRVIPDGDAISVRTAV